jgi:hypothetical protein
MATYQLLRNFMKILIWASIVAVTISTSPIQAADSDGCYAVNPGCISNQSGWKNGKFVVRLSNNCGARIYLRYCVRTTNGRGACEASGVAAGRRQVSTMYSADSSGSLSWRVVGSNRGMKDWVCADKFDGWNDPMY